MAAVVVILRTGKESFQVWAAEEPSLTVAVSCLKQLWPWKLKDC